MLTKVLICPIELADLKGSASQLEQVNEELGHEIDRLRSALEDLSCRHATVAPLWWQQQARDALSSEETDNDQTITK